MLIHAAQQQIWLYAQPVDMRKQFDGLAVLAQSQLRAQASSGDVFVFVNRKRTQIKILYYDSGGYCLWSKRLEKGRFHHVLSDSDKIGLNWTQLHCLIDGINWQKMQKNKRFRR
ncbi:MAG: IS66 family insertion sequence element accessory protein TnpB [Pseudoalteromonas rhizosphaerae]|uniref:IS66 family insertion sequence element accessory protein TnpB n=1 Tax=Pseudoalteromonas rhizosphaerae TaxID=2518973 RepID=UPI003C76CB02